MHQEVQIAIIRKASERKTEAARRRRRRRGEGGKKREIAALHPERSLTPQTATKGAPVRHAAHCADPPPVPTLKKVPPPPLCLAVQESDAASRLRGRLTVASRRGADRTAGCGRRRRRAQSAIKEKSLSAELGNGGGS